jgi:predicted DNA-binding transcriptional regulator AlpA
MDRLLTRKQVAEFLGIQTATLARWKWAGKDGPPHVNVGRSIRYRQSDVEAWMKSDAVAAKRADAKQPDAFDLSCRFGPLYKLSKHDRRKVCREIAEACEKSFRRGFHQGREGVGDVVVDLMEWRFNTPLSESPSPHGTYDSDSITRHSHEVGLPPR